MAHGFDNTLVVARETDFGVAPSTGYNWIGIVESFEPEESNNVEQRRSIGVRAPFLMRQGAKEVDGSATVALQNARPLLMALGYEDVTDNLDGTYTHAIRPIKAGEKLPSLTFQNHNSAVNLTRNYVGGKVDTLTLNASAEEAVTLDMDIQFSHVESGESIVPIEVVPEYDNYFMFYEGTTYINNVAVSEVREFELEVANGLERRFVLNGSNKPARIEEGALEISLSLTLDFIDKTYWDAFQNGDNLVVKLEFVDQADPTHKISLELTGGMYDTNAISVGAEDLQEQELEAVFTDMSVEVVDSNATLI